MVAKIVGIDVDTANSAKVRRERWESRIITSRISGGRGGKVVAGMTAVSRIMTAPVKSGPTYSPKLLAFTLQGR